MASHVLAHPTLSTHFSSCAVGHPSMQLEEYAFQRSTLALIQRTSKPVIWLPAKGTSSCVLVSAMHAYDVVCGVGAHCL
ncbi:hypothetical protein EON65_37765 [archaeon]|nr:MAG: hypothetical protein EON65_37765 [archaeon]